jgi:hypothetical protein
LSRSFDRLRFRIVGPDENLTAVGAAERFTDRAWSPIDFNVTEGTPPHPGYLGAGNIGKQVASISTTRSVGANLH